MTTGLDASQKEMIAKLAALKRVRPTKNSTPQVKRSVSQDKWEEEDIAEPDWTDAYQVYSYAIKHKVQNDKVYHIMINSIYAMRYSAIVLRRRDSNFEKWFEELLGNYPIKGNGSVDVNKEKVIDVDDMTHPYGYNGAPYIELMKIGDKWDGLFEAFKLSLRGLNCDRRYESTLQSINLDTWSVRFASADKFLSLLVRLCIETRGSYDKLKECFMAFLNIAKEAIADGTAPAVNTRLYRIEYADKYLVKIDNVLNSVLSKKEAVFGMCLNVAEEFELLDCYFKWLDLFNNILKCELPHAIRSPLLDLTAVVVTVNSSLGSLGIYLSKYKGNEWPGLNNYLDTSLDYDKYRLAIVSNSNSLIPARVFDRAIAEIEEAYHKQSEILLENGLSASYHEEGHSGMRRLGSMLNTYVATVVQDRVESLEKLYVTTKQYVSFNHYIDRIKSLKRMGYKIKNI